MINTINNLNFIYDKVCSSFNLNVYLFASTTVNRYSLPKKIVEKFQYFHCIRPVDNNHKGALVRFIASKIGIEIKMTDYNLNKFGFENLYTFSNEDIFDLIRNAIRIKKQNGPPDDENWVYREGLYEEDLKKDFDILRGSLTTEIRKLYCL